MNNEFDDVMRKRTDADLIRILNSPAGDYQDTAVEAAKRELDNRNLSETQVITAKQEIEQVRKIDEIKANEPLGIGWKIFVAMFPGIIMLIFAGTFKADGYDRKAKEMRRWTLYGFCFYFSLAILLSLLP